MKRTDIQRKFAVGFITKKKVIKANFELWLANLIRKFKEVEKAFKFERIKGLTDGQAERNTFILLDTFMRMTEMYQGFHIILSNCFQH